MTTEPIPASLSLDAATYFAQLRRDNERLQARNIQLEEQVRALIVLQGIANTLTAELNLTPLLHRVAIAALRLTAAQASAVYLVDPSRTALVVEAVETLETAEDSGRFIAPGGFTASHPGSPLDELFGAGKPRIPFSDAVAGSVAANGKVVLVPDAQNDLRFPLNVLATDSNVLGVRPRGLVAVPLWFKGDVTGVLEVAQTEGSVGFDASSLDLMGTLAAQAATAVANAQLYRGLRTERDRIIQTQEDERKRLGRDLHDGPAQKLAQIAMSLEFAERLATQEPESVVPELRTIREMALSTTREIRNLLFDLRPLVLDAENGGLVVALQHFLERFENAPSASQAPRMHLKADYPDRLSHNVELTVFAILQEAVNNVLKHGNARNCWIEVHLLDDRLVATIRDDGDGFDVNQVRSEYEHRGSWGLLNMMERAALIEAKFNIASQPGEGTVTSLVVPR
jgi:signal transduction histidine kinase